jgi:hypothetical protein
MSLSSEYKSQFAWRAWPSIFDALPPVRGQLVLDLGRGVGDQAAELVARGARIVGEPPPARGLDRDHGNRRLFGHEPLGADARSLLEAYAQEALLANRYTVHMGRKLRDHLERSGFTISKVLTLEDQELSFGGPARPEVVDAWRSRFDRMKLLRDLYGPRLRAGP